MVKYVDARTDSGDASKKKKSRKGFKADRLENYKRMLAKKSGKKVKETPTPTTRPKAITFDDADRRNYLLTLHKKKNERRVQAFVDMKRKLRKDNAKTRRGQREEARRAYNNYARVPILPDYTYRLPDRQDEGFGEEDEEEEEEEDGHYGEGNVDDHSSQEGGEEEMEGDMPWVYIEDSEEAARDAHARPKASAENKEDASRKRKKAKRLATVAHSSHAMPGVMLGHEAGEVEGDAAATATRSSSSVAEDELVTVEVKPLFARPGSSSTASSTGDGGAVPTAKPLPSNNFDDLPVVVQQELRRLRQEIKGPAKTKPRLHMMKELEKIRKIRKYSRKGHGKRKASGKRKNRKK
ncbi:hypothetical protein ABB37_03177 [Leptomonas pyrrhocoris]|uniref:Uncharacterized protein n=1 Tax=Leptomonas pyrrhocoris TaxID=157538 RepID=A0A0N0VG05_LEPPY|nr:hypothetical protein ABB37_03177 [Leptomonas pyrrhocoris]KPA81998.1 hypothetical protein ABB37_03177 [Leptomonas pyrrhocoris]|eukprot:XP_015660437.1 hypothetical protein ABB37_03177 [Leptomonas pyrrhocoris]